MELVLEMAPLAPRLQIDAVIETFVGHLFVAGNRRLPILLRADEIVELRFRAFQSNGGNDVGANKMGRELQRIGDVVIQPRRTFQESVGIGCRLKISPRAATCSLGYIPQLRRQ